MREGNVCPAPSDPSEDKDAQIRWACRKPGCEFRPTEWSLDHAFGSPHDVRNFERAWRTRGVVTRVWGGGRLKGAPKVYTRYAYPRGRKQISYIAEMKETGIERPCGLGDHCPFGGAISQGALYLHVADYAGAEIKNRHRKPNRDNYHLTCAKTMGYGHAVRRLAT